MLVPYNNNARRFTEVYALDETVNISRLPKKRNKGFYVITGDGRVFMRYIKRGSHYCKVIVFKNGGIMDIEREVFNARSCFLCEEMKYLL